MAKTTYKALGPDEGLLAVLVKYLEDAGWYFDWEHIDKVWGDAWDDEDEDEEDNEPTLNKRPDAIYSLNGWTVPQWGEYWSSDHLPPKGPKPRTRRYEGMKEALWSQLYREQKPEEMAVFFDAFLKD